MVLCKVWVKHQPEEPRFAVLLHVDIGCRRLKQSAILDNPYPAGPLGEKEPAVLSNIDCPRHLKILGKHLNA